jgi:hypothetical protein
MYVPIDRLPADARIWIFQSPRPLTNEEADWVREETRRFVEEWTAHNVALRAGFDLLDGHFLILGIDERQAMASGCSIDKSVHLIRRISERLGADLLDRMHFAFGEGERLRVVGRKEFARLVETGEIGPETIVYNNLVDRLADLRSGWKIPFAESWHRQLV